jgi:DinB family
MIKKWYTLSALLFITLVTQAQFADSLKRQLLKDWKRSKDYTLDYLSTMPADQYSLRPHDSIKTFAQQMIHMAQGTIGLMEAATAKKIPGVINRMNLESTPAALTKDSVIYFVTLSYDYAIEALELFAMDSCWRYVTRGNFKETRLAWMLKAYEHQAHHRGQTAIYIRVAGHKPPFERLFDK